MTYLKFTIGALIALAMGWSVSKNLEYYHSQPVVMNLSSAERAAMIKDYARKIEDRDKLIKNLKAQVKHLNTRIGAATQKIEIKQAELLKPAPPIKSATNNDLIRESKRVLGDLGVRSARVVER